MPIVHFPPEIFDEKPWLGVLLGLTCIVIFALISYSAAQDSLNYSRQQAPELLDLKQEKVELSATRRWVTLTNFRLDCQVIRETKRMDLVERWLFGEVDNTCTVIPDDLGGILMIVKFDGEITCSDFQGSSLTGVLTNTTDLLYGGVPDSFGKTTRLVLYVDQGPEQSKILLITGVFLLILGVHVVISSGRKWAERSETHQTGTFSE